MRRAPEFGAYPVSCLIFIASLFMSPEGATHHSPGQRPGSEHPPLLWGPALKGRDRIGETLGTTLSVGFVVL